MLFLAAPQNPAPQAAAPRQPESVRIFLDCQAQGCDEDYLRTHITFVNYVRFREDAAVYVLVTGEENGSGGSTATLFFIGQGPQSGRSDTLRFSSSSTDTEDEIRSGLARALKMGLMRYVAGTDVAGRIQIFYERPDSSGADAPARGRDRWNSWVFELSAEAYLSGESQTSSRFSYGSFETARITETWKLQTDFSFDSSRDRFQYPVDSTRDTTIYSVSHGTSLEGLVTRSLGPRWSAGAFAEYSNSTYSNLKSQFWVGPAIEFDIFPYADFTRRRIVFLYTIGASRQTYADTTLYGKIEETVVRHQLNVSLAFKQRWGSTGITVTGSQYLHDLSKNQVQVYGNVELRLVRGLSLNVGGNYSRIRDQISLPAGGATQQEILLRRRQLATSYRYYMNLGLSYTFGSTFNNVVNNRFDNIGGLF
jgi:hypothetical protein